MMGVNFSEWQGKDTGQLGPLAVSQGRLQADDRAAHQMVGNHKGVRFDLRKRRRQGVQAAPQQIEASGARPTRELTLNIVGVN